MATIQAVVNENFLTRVAAIQKGEKRAGGDAINRALSGSSSEGKITTSVRAGSKLYARALTGINFGISFLNFARSDLEQVSSITDEMIRVVEDAASPSSSKNERLVAQRTLRELGSDVKEILRGAEVGERKYLTGEGIREVFSAIGLDPQKSRPTRQIFDKFIALDQDETLVDPGIKGSDSPIPKELGKPNTAQGSKDLFNGARSISKTADAYAILDDLKAFSSQVKNNIAVVDELAQKLGENALLVRTTALAFLEIEDSLTDEPQAADVARQLQRLILKDAKAALSQAENLEPIVVATLTYKDSGIVQESS
ncbi:MAG: hypothetical protein KDD70_17485 [Bdellovibrionales bacterium]|nr:hypothetical protein [Bdellovibrionales bacterium]